MKKVLHILPMNQLSGAEKMALLICKNLTQYESIVVTGGEVLKEVFESNGIQSYSLNFSKKKLLSRIGTSPLSNVVAGKRTSFAQAT